MTDLVWVKITHVTKTEQHIISATAELKWSVESEAQLQTAELKRSVASEEYVFPQSNLFEGVLTVC